MPGRLLDFIRSSIKRKMILITTVIILFVVFTISFFTINETSRTIKADVQHYSTQILKQANLNLNRYFEEYEQGFISMGVSEEFQKWLSVEKGNKAELFIKFVELENKYIRAFMLRYPEVLSVSLLNTNGNEVYQAGSQGVDLTYSFKDRLEELASLPLAVTKITVENTDYYRDSNGKSIHKVISLTRVFRDWRDFTRGYIKVDISLEPMNSILGDIYLGKGGYVLVADTEGNVVTGTGAGSSMEKLDEDLLALVKTAASGSFFLSDAEDLVMYAVIPYTRWTTIAIIPYEDVAGSIIHLRRVTLLVTMGSLTAAIILIILFASTITSRLTRLRTSIRQVQKGNLDGVVTVDGIDEVSDLSRAYNRMLSNLNATVQDLAEAKVFQQEAVLSALQSQINSHFLYNTLESINSMANLANHKNIERVTIALSVMLRYTSDYKNTVVRLEDEIRHLVNYMEIIQIRYGGAVDYTLSIDERCRKVDCLKAILQPLVENCIKHGIEVTGKPIKIAIRADVEDDSYVRICIEDNGKGFDDNKLLELQRELAEKRQQEGCGKFTQIGLLNVQDRLRVFHKDDKTGIRVRNADDGGAVIEILFPIRYSNEGGAQ